MKFGKEFNSQMIPEWEDAYMNYNKLKLTLKDILKFKESRRVSTDPPQGLNRKMSLYRAFSGLTHPYYNLRSPRTTNESNEEHAILINQNSDKCETKFLMSTDDGGEYELVFFRRLDEEFNKVNDFYKQKIQEAMKEADSLNKQMNAFIAFRIRVDNPPGFFPNNAPTFSQHYEPGHRNNLSPGTDATHMDAISEIEMGEEEAPLSNNNSINTANTSNLPKNKKNNGNQAHGKPPKPAPIEILDRVTINVSLETPRSTIKNILKDSNQRDLNYNSEELKRIEERLRQAFIAFYERLRLLKNFSFLNIVAFSKIMKKYDKITSRRVSRHYLEMVDRSPLGNSDEITRLLERVESTFIKHFCNSNRRKGMQILRPATKRQRHRTTFTLGFTSGCAISLLVALIFLLRARIHTQDLKTTNGNVTNTTGIRGTTLYMDTLFPLYSLYGYVVLHLLMYGGNIFFWKRYRVNYAFIFGFKQGTELGYRQVLLVSSSLAVLALLAVLTNLDMEMDPSTKDYGTFTEWVPFVLLMLVLVILFLPFNIIYRSSRYFLLVATFHCILAPLYKVLLPDFFLADQLTSEVPAFRSLEFYVCYYGWGNVSKRENYCDRTAVFNIFYFIVAVIPYMMRLLQCLRRLVEEKDPMQGYNGLKYFSTIVALIFRTAYEKNKGVSWRVLAALSSLISAIVSTYWDIVMDWGLLQRQSKNKWLRDKLLVPHKKVYFTAIGLNCLLRFAWLQSVLNLQVPFLHGKGLSAIFACLEIIRRGIWNFFRLENEHLNNVGKFRAFKSVPLPFNYEEDEDKDE